MSDMQTQAHICPWCKDDHGENMCDRGNLRCRITSLESERDTLKAAVQGLEEVNHKLEVDLKDLQSSMDRFWHHGGWKLLEHGDRQKQGDLEYSHETCEWVPTDKANEGEVWRGNRPPICRHMTPANAEGWIRCEDRMPKDGDLVLAHGALGHYTAYRSNISLWYTRNGGSSPIPTHWQPLPPAPNEGSRTAVEETPTTPIKRTEVDESELQKALDRTSTIKESLSVPADVARRALEALKTCDITEAGDGAWNQSYDDEAIHAAIKLLSDALKGEK